MINNSADFAYSGISDIISLQDWPFQTSVGETQDSAEFMTESVACKANLFNASCNSVIKKPFLDMQSSPSSVAPSCACIIVA